MKACKVYECTAAGIFDGLCGSHDALGETIVTAMVKEAYARVPAGNIRERQFPTGQCLGNLYWVYSLVSNDPIFSRPFLLIRASGKLRLVNVSTGRLLAEDDLFMPGVYVTLAAESKGRELNG